MDEPTNAEIMTELQSLGGLVKAMDKRVRAVEADMAVLRSAYASQGKTIGDLLRSTPLPPPEAAPTPEDDEEFDEDTHPSIEVNPEDG
jgi:hypothetical protein